MEPDPRFTLANERTYLAWNRTALAVIAGGLAVTQLVRLGSADTAPAIAVGITLIVVGAALSFASYRNWQRKDEALRMGRPLPRSSLPRILALVVGGIAVVAVLLAALLLAAR
ncbi:MAG: DUF202 domain-containing protein [Candidatus Dormibacteraeota bacterium]|nr:DUF202 domain-containing protein [Candidatus Dormibacteraeota bacterium]MBV9525480.1 DUF202 domain-containing protein [Candidatus Dormibacteraeota bacterium]